MGIIDSTGTQNMLYLTRTMISSVDLAQYGVYGSGRLFMYKNDVITNI